MILKADIFNSLTVGFNEVIPEISEEKVLGIVIDFKLIFQSLLKIYAPKTQCNLKNIKINNL